ncbi:hypothetical protein KLP40_10855 [Hymenobacter sp. NST-14]|uniref:hypothetical protein n=1 Tax=Hymenobacter piscis TaxID=2839984 RepID=UPI001C02BFD9|nr:hypothetical protein [Hymenobacter piscis]MBT9393662.1 hypothetical protein [Hymenobacter piscis]
MKYLFSFLLLGASLAAGTTALAQTAPAKPAAAPATVMVQPARYEYCELTHVGVINSGTGTPDKGKTEDIYVDFGYGYEKLGGSEQMKREAGRLEVFATPISAINYMGGLGWEIVQILETPVNSRAAADASRYVRRYVLRRALSAKALTPGR